MHVSRWKFLSVIIVCGLGILFSFPNVVSPDTRKNWPDWLQSTVNLGLELRGGSHLQFEVDFKDAEKDHLLTLLSDVRKALRKENLGYKNLRVENGYLRFELRDEDERNKVFSTIKKLDPAISADIEFRKTVNLHYNEQAIEARRKAILEQSKEVIRRRIDETGTKEPAIFTQGKDRIIVQLPGVDDPKEVKRRIGKTAKLTFRLVDHSVAPNSSYAPAGSELLSETLSNGQTVLIAVKKNIEVSGDQLTDAQATNSQNGQPAVALKFNSAGARKFADMSARNLKKQFAIVLDNQVISAPVFQEVIPDGSGQISGSFTLKEAHELALLLRAGSLPAPLKVVEERTIGPSLGADSVADGKTATILAFVLVAVFMLLFYSTFGFFANIALIFNLILLFAGLSLLQATLTLPGIAGIAMTIGMAVDANVLIYERIKEELRAGTKSLRAIESGFKRAMSTIIDANLTTLIGAAVLYEFGSGPIRGFGVTLALGIIISMFTALTVTKTLVALWFRNWPNTKKLPI